MDLRQVRHIIQHGTQHRLTPARVDGVTAVQYTSVDSTEVVVLAFRPLARHGAPNPPVRLQGLDPTANYAYGDTVHSGAALLHLGLPLDLPTGDHASTLIHLRRQ